MAALLNAGIENMTDERDKSQFRLQWTLVFWAVIFGRVDGVVFVCPSCPVAAMLIY